MQARRSTQLVNGQRVACTVSIIAFWVANTPSRVFLAGCFGQRRVHGLRYSHPSAKRLSSLRASGGGIDLELLQDAYDQSAFDGVGRGEARFFESRAFDSKQWQQHASSARYVRDIPGLFWGITSSRVMPIITLLAVFSSFVELYSFAAARTPELPEVQLPAAPFEFTAPLLGLLLVFRTNSSYLRYAAASRAIQNITGSLHSYVRQLLTWSDGETQSSAADVDHIIELAVAYHCWLLSMYLHVQKDGHEGNKALAKLNTWLGRPVDSPLTPAQVHVLLAWEAHQLPHLTAFQRKDMDQALVAVTKELACCEQLLRTPIPLAYTRSLLRFLWLWLTLLPFSLVKTFTDFGKGTWWEGQPLYVVPAVTCFIGLLFLSLEDIAVQIEEPFVVHRRQLRRLSKWFRQDADEMRSVVRHLEATRRCDSGQPK